MLTLDSPPRDKLRRRRTRSTTTEPTPAPARARAATTGAHRPIDWAAVGTDTATERPSRLGAGWAVVLVVGWIATWEIAMAVAPAADPDAGFHWLQGVSMATFFAVVATVVVSAVRQISATGMGLFTGGLGLFAALACGAFGHVPFASAAFVVPVVLFAGMTVLSSVARRTHLA